MYYQDDFVKTFDSEEKFLNFLQEIESRASWEVHKTSELKVIAAEESRESCKKIEMREDGSWILADTKANTGLLLEAENVIYPLGFTAIKTLKERARIGGTALRDLPKATLAWILNECLQVTKGRAMLRIHEGKVRAVHGGDSSDYAVLSMPELYEAAASRFREQYQSLTFCGASFDHSMVSADWKIRDDGLLNAYDELLIHYGQEKGAVASALIRIVTSDVGTSGANIYCSLLTGNGRLCLGKPIKLEHGNQNSIIDFEDNLGHIFAIYQETVKGVEKLFHVYVENPANVMIGLMKKAGIGKNLIAQTTERFKSSISGGCSGYDVYAGICEAVFLAESNGMGKRALADLEEHIARCLTYRFSDYDISGEFSY